MSLSHPTPAARTRRFAPPDGLDRARPREVRLRAGGYLVIGLGVLFALGSVGVFAALQFRAQRKLDEVRLLREQGVVTPATVTRRWRTGGEDRRHMVAYRLASSNHEQVRRVSSQRWNAIPAVGETVFVRSVPGRDELTHLEGAAPSPQPAFVSYLAGGSMLAFGAVLMAIPWPQRRLLGGGRVARATVVQRGKASEGATFTFEFATLGGRVVRGKSTLDKKTPPLGGVLTVIYDPDPPHRSAPYPFSLVQPVEKRPLGR